MQHIIKFIYVSTFGTRYKYMTYRSVRQATVKFVLPILKLHFLLQRIAYSRALIAFTEKKLQGSGLPWSSRASQVMRTSCVSCAEVGLVNFKGTGRMYRGRRTGVPLQGIVSWFGCAAYSTARTTGLLNPEGSLTGRLQTWAHLEQEKLAVLGLRDVGWVDNGRAKNGGRVRDGCWLLGEEWQRRWSRHGKMTDKASTA